MADSHRIRIEYCVPCSARPYSNNLVTRLLEEHEKDVTAIEVVMGENGIFDVHLDGELAFTKSMLGRYQVGARHPSSNPTSAAPMAGRAVNASRAPARRTSGCFR